MRLYFASPKIIDSSTQGGSRPSGGGVEEIPLKSCLSVSRVETGTPGGGGCLSETRVLVSLSEVLVSLNEVLVSGS